MTRNILTLTIGVAACALMATPSLEAQCSDCGTSAGGRLGRLTGRVVRPVGSGAVIGKLGSAVGSRTSLAPIATVRAAARDNFTPHRAYTYSRTGQAATAIDAWNQSEQDVYAWHGGYQNWRWGTPTALVVPPTASYMTSYAWGVGQTRTTPIHHQFGRGNAAMVGGGNGGQGFSWTPYWPSSTDQFGIYPVRSPW
ncbi:MAG: hypothetical protein AAF664_22275 [Planctomycetota bacterium]